MNITLRNTCALLALTAGLTILCAGRPAEAQSYNASPFIVGTADHGFEGRPSGNFTFTEGAVSGSRQGLTLNAHVKHKAVTLAEIGALLAMGIMGLHSFDSAGGGSSPVNTSTFASLTTATITSSFHSGNSVQALSPAPVPELGTGASFGLLAALGAAGMIMARRKRPTAA